MGKFQVILLTVLFGVRARATAVLRRDYRYEISPGHVIKMPPEHKLPLYQRVHPLYDRYFLPFLSTLGTFTLIDIGANVGDTTVAILAVAPETNVICVEGSDYYLRYLRKNVGTLQNVRIVDAFVSTGSDAGLEYVHTAGTGRLKTVTETEASSDSGMTFISAAKILDQAQAKELVVWKSDTDGFDVSILLTAFEEIVARCEIIWFELQLFNNSNSEMDQLSAFLTKLGTTSRQVVIFDNFGRLMLSIDAGQSLQIISQLQRWVKLQDDSGHLAVNYFDVWILPPARADALVAKALGD
jgi:FkbM family methyltransferase